MALGAATGALLGGLASGAASYGLGQIFGPEQGTHVAPLQNFQPTGINAGGLRSSFSGGNLSVMPTAERLALIKNISDVLGLQAGELGGLRSKVAPGMSDLRAARLAEIENARERSIGNLRDNLARRRVLGSSFGQDALSRGEAEFANLRQKTAAETFMQELELTNNLVNQEFAARRQTFQVGLDDMNLQADVATKLTAKATETMGQNARLMAQLNVLEQQAAGKFFGDALQPVSKGIGAGVQGWVT
jgi:hypothetical protein